MNIKNITLPEKEAVNILSNFINLHFISKEDNKVFLVKIGEIQDFKDGMAICDVHKIEITGIHQYYDRFLSRPIFGDEKGAINFLFNLDPLRDNTVPESKRYGDIKEYNDLYIRLYDAFENATCVVSSKLSLPIDMAL